MPELRKDPVVGRWVIISTERARRPSDFAAEPVATARLRLRVLRGPRGRRPRPRFSRAGRPNAAPNGPGWTYRVVPNKFPALRIEGDLEPSGEGLFDRMNGRRRSRGRHRDARPRRVARHASGRRRRRRAARVPRARARSQEGPALRLRPRVQEPRRGGRRVARASALAADRDADHPDHGVRGARRLGPVLRAQGALRLVRHACGRSAATAGASSWRSQGFVAVAPFAPRFPFETWILPVRHRAAFEDSSEEELRGLAGDRSATSFVV